MYDIAGSPPQVRERQHKDPAKTHTQLKLMNNFIHFDHL